MTHEDEHKQDETEDVEHSEPVEEDGDTEAHILGDKVFVDRPTVADK